MNISRSCSNGRCRPGSRVGQTTVQRTNSRHLPENTRPKTPDQPGAPRLDEQGNCSDRVPRNMLMKNQFWTIRLLTLAAALSLAAPGVVLAQAGHEHNQAAEATQKKMHGMMAETAAKKAANTARLETLMAQINNSSGETRVAAMSQVIAILLEERAGMIERCHTMMGK